MALIEYTLEGKINKVDIAINRIKTFDPISTGFMDEPYYVAYSGGKDSDALRILFELSGVKHNLFHNHTTVDAPETVNYIRSIPGVKINYPSMTMWRLIESKSMPPTRIVRYCCKYLKERGSERRFTVTGVRRDESMNRKGRNSLEVVTAKQKNKVILNADNGESRKLFENCQTKGRRILNPIVDWTNEEVWEFLRHYGCESNSLYQQGYKRIGCVGCPMSRVNMRMLDFERYPKYKQNYIRAFDRMIAAANENGKPCRAWKTGQEVFDWWIKDPVKKSEIDKMQLTLFDNNFSEVV